MLNRNLAVFTLLISFVPKTGGATENNVILNTSESPKILSNRNPSQSVSKKTIRPAQSSVTPLSQPETIHPAPEARSTPSATPREPIFQAKSPESSQIERAFTEAATRLYTQKVASQSQAKDLSGDFTISASQPSLPSVSQASPNPAEAQTPTYKPSALEKPPSKLGNYQTANQLPEGTVQLEAGFNTAFPNDVAGSGTGFQVYYLSLDWAVSDRFQLGLTADGYDDITKEPIRGRFPSLTAISIAPNFKYQLLKNEQFTAAVSGSIQWLRLSSEPGLFNNFNRANPSNLIVGTLQTPLTFELGNQVQLHFTPGLAFFPGQVNNADFYGTFLNLGAGLSWQASERLNLFATLNYPIAGKGNAVSSTNGDIFRKLLWTAGAQYAINPRVGVELYATNAFGATPATSLLAFIPNGDDFILGANVKYLFDFNQGYAPRFGNQPVPPLSDRDAQLLLDGFTISSAETLAPDRVRISGGLTTGGNRGVFLAYGLANDLQLEFPIEEYADEGLSRAETAGSGVKFGPGVKLRFLNQAAGDPVSLSLKVLGVRDFSERPRVGTLSAELPIVYQPSPQTALFFSPRAAFSGNTDRIGIGLGINQQIARNVQFIGEFTPVLNGYSSIWAAGLRYFEPRSKLGIDVYAGNAVGQSGLGSLVTNQKVWAGLRLHWMF